jgi:GNAT superfamily N-acetyltransferase
MLDKLLKEIALPEGLVLRLATAVDQAFMERVFCSTREHFYLMPLPKLQLEILLKQQFVLQQSSYSSQFPHAHTFVVELGDQEIGKITLNQSGSDLHIIDMALLPQTRNKGYGTRILKSIQLWTKKQKLQLKLSVDQQNIRAKKLYLVLGFNTTSSSETHDTMVWLPAYS